jgi:glycosyltransferase involved in cell wall biosynthesis
VRILYVASDQVLPGRTGGSVHVLEVACGLAARGHDVHAVLHRTPGSAEREPGGPGVTLHRTSWWPPSRFFRFRARAAVETIAREVKPHAVMERYYNFGGEGVLAAAGLGVPSLLEVNAPVIDHPGSWKARVDALALVRPLRRYRERLCAQAAALVSPLREIVPEAARDKTEVVTWGANVDAFHPQQRSARVRAELGIPEGATAVLFSGSFRPWHGVHVLEHAAHLVREREDLFFVLAGGPGSGPAAGFRGQHLGRTRACRRWWRPATSRSPPTTPRARPSSSSASTGRPSRSSRRWRRVCPR